MKWLILTVTQTQDHPEQTWKPFERVEKVRGERCVNLCKPKIQEEYGSTFSD